MLAHDPAFALAAALAAPDRGARPAEGGKRWEITHRIAQTQRAHAAMLLKMAEDGDGLLPWAATHQHLYGNTTYVLWYKKMPSQEAVEEAIRAAGSSFEEEKEEFIHIEQLAGGSMSFRRLVGVPAYLEHYDGPPLTLRLAAAAEGPVPQRERGG